MAPTENEIATTVVDACYQIHTRLGPGLLEPVYEAVLARELAACGLNVAGQVVVPLVWNGVQLKKAFRADLMVEGKVVIELKSVRCISQTHVKQLLTQLRLADKRLGLIVNFGAPLMKEGIRRVVNGLEEDPTYVRRRSPRKRAR